MLSVRGPPASTGTSGNASDPEAVVPRGDTHTEGTKRVRHGRDAVFLLHAELLCAPHLALATRTGGREREERELVDQQRHFRRRDGGRRQLRRPNLEVSDRLPAPGGPGDEGAASTP